LINESRAYLGQRGKKVNGSRFVDVNLEWDMECKSLRYLWLIGLIVPLATLAGEAYRSVDESGQVIFSDAPPAGKTGVEVIELPQGPSNESRQEAESRLDAYRQKLEESRRQREAENKQREAEIAKLKAQLAEAEARLRDAREFKDEDRQSIAGKGRRIKPEYFQRVEEAEAAVAEARKRLNQARSRR
jgi:Skp family chaperone for outer membrane proteins